MNLVYPESPVSFLKRSFFGVLFFMVFSFFLAVMPVQASGVIVSLDEMTVDLDGTAVVTARVEGLEAPGLVGYDFKITYLPSVVNLIALTKTTDFAEPTPVFNSTDPNPFDEPGEILVNSAQEYGKTGDIALFTLTFKAVGTVGQSSPITLTVKNLVQNYYTDNGVLHDLSEITHTTNNGKLTIGSILPPSIVVSPTVLTEASANDGSLTTADITLTLENGTFDTDIVKSDVSITNLPVGMDYTVARTSDTVVAVTLTGKATSHDNANDTTLTLTMAHSKVIGASADITGTIELDFASNAVQKSITSVSTIDDISVPNGTILASIGLPNSLQVTLDDSSNQNINVTWNGGNPSYNATIAGTYTFTGTFTNLPAGVTNQNNLTSTVNVLVASESTSGASYTLTVGKKLGRGDKVPQVSIPISIDKLGVTQYSFDLTYDATKILPVDVTGTGINGAVVPLTTTISTSANTGTVHVTWNGTPTTAAGKLFNVVFSVQTTLAKTDPDSVISISNANFTLGGSVTNNSTVIAGFVRYGMFGDIDNNGSINNLDIGLAKQAYSKTKVLTSNQIMAADVTGEGIINNLDIGALKQKYSGTLLKFKVE